MRRSFQLLTHRVAVIGGGPSGFYLAKALVTKMPDAFVDVFDKSPVPFGLVRYGVAPDHPEVKAVNKTFARLFEGEPGKASAVAFQPRVRFYGNVAVGGGADVTAGRLLKHYHQVVVATGASADKQLGIPGEDRCLPCGRLIDWYNGVPGSAPVDLSGVRSVAVVGNGNVAVDCARILLAPPQLLQPTDIVTPAATAVAASAIRSVTLVARRGVLNAAFTIKEFREMLTLGEADAKKPWYVPAPADLPWLSTEIRDANHSEADLEAATRARKRLTDLVLSARGKEGAGRQFVAQFLSRPVEVTAAGLVVERMADIGGGRVEGTGEMRTIPADLVLKSVGYRGTPLAVDGAAADPDVPHDAARGVVPSTPEGRVKERLYAVGWAKNGAQGVIVAALADANAVAAAMVADRANADLSECDGAGSAGLVQEWLQNATSWEDWRRLERAEEAAGAAAGKTAEKVTSTADMLSLMRSA